MKRLDVKFKNEGTYPVIISDDYSELPGMIKEMYPSLKRICIVSDSDVAPLYLMTVRSLLSDCCEKISDHVFPAGEGSKTYETVLSIYDTLLKNDFNRKDLIIALGGGVTGDMAAFAASTYMRGTRFINLPTSLLAMADSSVGGKCGVDYDLYKNIVGSIYMPSLVYASTQVLSSLPDRQYSSGMAEILKAGLIKDATYYEWLISSFSEIMDRDSEYTAQMIERAVSIKQFFVTKDPFETGDRMMLNFGHTIGHALEKYYDFKYLHGECVALGMVAAAYISYKRSMLSKEEFYEIRDMFVPFSLPISLDRFDAKTVCSYIGHDKKNTDTGLKFILLKKIGKAVIANDVTSEEIEEAVKTLYVEFD